MMAPPLDVHAPPTAATCNAEVCRVVRDAEVLAPQSYRFLDFRVATSSDTTYLTLGASGTVDYRSQLLALDANGRRPIEQGDVPNLSLPLVAVDASGTLQIAGATTVPAGQDVMVEAGTWDGTAWSQTVLGKGSGSPAALELEVGRSGYPSIFWEDATLAYWLSNQEPNGTFSSTSISGRADDYALDAQGLPVLFDYGGSSYGAKDAAGAELLTVQVPDESANASVLLKAAPAIPQALPAGVADFALVALHPDGLHVVLGARASGLVANLTIPNTALPSVACPDSDTLVTGMKPGDQCRAPCPAHAIGLVPGGNPLMSESYALARTADGVSWLAYVMEDLDGEVDYSVWCAPEGGSCSCRASRPTGPTVWTLHVARVTPDGASSAEALSVPLAQYFNPDVGWPVRAHAFGERVVVAVGIHASATDATSGVRVVTFEATK
jgi:hypothetical protein